VDCAKEFARAASSFPPRIAVALNKASKGEPIAIKIGRRYRYGKENEF
jgi:hypothetical protein